MVKILKQAIEQIKSGARVGRTFIKAHKATKQANYDTAVLRAAKRIEGMPDAGNESDPNFRTRVQANEVRDRLKRNNQGR